MDFKPIIIYHNVYRLENVLYCKCKRSKKFSLLEVLSFFFYFIILFIYLIFLMNSFVIYCENIYVLIVLKKENYAHIFLQYSKGTWLDFTLSLSN